MTCYNPVTKVFSGPKFPSIYDAKIPLGQVLLYHCYKAPDKVIQVSVEDGTETCETIANKMTTLSKHLMKMNFQIGDTVGVIGKNTSYLSPLIFGCILIGLPVCPVDVSSDVNRIIEVYEKVKPKIVFCDSDLVIKVKEVLEILKNNAKIITLTEKVEGLTHIRELFIEQTDSFFTIPEEFDLNTSEICAAILCSSGTTGAPKLVRLSHRQFLELFTFYGFYENTFLFNFSSICWITGFMLMVQSILNGQKRLITTKSFTPQLCHELIEKFKVTHIFLTPSQIAEILRSPLIDTADLSTIKRITTGGWFISKHLRQKMQEKLPNGKVIVGYGMTEMASNFCATYPNDEVSTSIGKLSVNVEGKIMIGTEAGGVNEIGDIFVRRPSSFLGYLNNEIEIKEILNDDEWTHTGDMGFFDEHFDLHIVGRKQFAIRCFNHQVHPNDIEDVIQKVPGIKNVCVVAIPNDNAYEAAGALVIKEELGTVTKEDIHRAISHLPKYMQLLGGVFFVNDLPLTTTGKLQRNIIEKLALHLTNE